jgi:putative RNA 2'-phosphotransferase
MIPYEFDAERFSRWMAYVLRHNPARYGLQPDRQGFVALDDFMQVAARRYPGMAAERLRQLIDAGSAGRFEIFGNRLRARYGHSIPVDPAGQPVEPPPRLYHGTSASRAEAILAEGLRPLDRRMVHISPTAEEALSVARRKTEQPVLLRIHALDAHRQGVAFYCEGKVYLVAYIPPQFISREPPAS